MHLKHYKQLDGLRGIAALMVMVFHLPLSYKSTNGIIQKILELLSFGQTGVALFFILSGFLITRILIATKTEENYYSSFYAKRVLRIFPLYYLSLLIYLYVFPLIIKTTPSTTADSEYYYIFYLQNIAMSFGWIHKGPTHLWSLAVEEQYYLFWPLVVAFASNRNLKKVCIFLVLFAIILRLVFFNDHLATLFFTFTNIDALAIGSVLAIMEYNDALEQHRNTVNITLFISMVATIILFCFFTRSFHPAIYIIKPLCVNLFYFLLLWSVIIAKDSSQLYKVLSNRIFVYCGLISYGLYVYHPICYAFIKQYVFISNPVLLMSFCFISSAVVATISYYCFEKWFIGMKKYFRLKCG